MLTSCQIPHRERDVGASTRPRPGGLHADAGGPGHEGSLAGEVNARDDSRVKLILGVQVQTTNTFGGLAL